MYTLGLECTQRKCNKCIGSNVQRVPRYGAKEEVSNLEYELVLIDIRFEADATNMMCLRAMTGAIILFDHLHAQGAFAKKSPINVSSFIYNFVLFIFLHFMCHSLISIAL